jgi:hypothetical protein
MRRSRRNAAPTAALVSTVLVRAAIRAGNALGIVEIELECSVLSIPFNHGFLIRASPEEFMVERAYAAIAVIVSTR